MQKDFAHFGGQKHRWASESSWTEATQPGLSPCWARLRVGCRVEGELAHHRDWEWWSLTTIRASIVEWFAGLNTETFMWKKQLICLKMGTIFSAPKLDEIDEHQNLKLGIKFSGSICVIPKHLINSSPPDWFWYLRLIQQFILTWLVRQLFLEAQICFLSINLLKVLKVGDCIPHEEICIPHS